ncbi:MAG: hypothetical protein RXO36_07445 [Candidatus Nanopusillus acidilobi]
MEYLKEKNRLFLKIFREFWKQKKYENIYYLQGGSGELNERFYDDYWDLLALYFSDEEGYNRALFMPLPLIPKKYRNKLRDMAWKGEIFHCSRAWHEITNNMYVKPDAYYPNFYFEKFSEKDFEYYNEEEQ